MLQRAASNACSWWWASHIRTKQSKWLDTDLEEMEERVKAMLKIVEQDGDSFARKAEMYFKKRPELIYFVEETYKAYKALADKYDHISSELHKANHTIATAFPDQIQFDMQDDDDIPKAITSIDPSKIRKPPIDIPPISLMNKKKENNTLKKSRLGRVASKNSKDKAQEEIDKLQKGILVLQTEKEYVKSAYESGITKYWDIEKQITEMQEEVFLLQDEYSACMVIEDDEARALMAVTALKSCEDTLVKLEDQQKRSMEEARIESERIMAAKEKIEVVKGEAIPTEDIMETNTEKEVESLTSESLCDIVNEQIEITTETSVVELAEKINELVTKVIEMELTASSQAAQIKSLRLESDLLHRHIRSFEEEKKTLIEESNNLRDKLKKAEERLQRADFEHVRDKISMVDDNSVEVMSGKYKDQLNIASPRNTEAGRANEKEVEDTSELEKHNQDERFLFEKTHIETCHSLGDGSERPASPKQWVDAKIASPSQEKVIPRDSGNKEVKGELDAVISLGEKQPVETNSPQADYNVHSNEESKPKLEKNFVHSEASSKLKDSSVKSQALIHGTNISSSLADGYIHQGKESKLELEKMVDNLEAGSQLEDDSVYSDFPEWEVEFSSSSALKHEVNIGSSLVDDFIHPSKESKQEFAKMVDNLEAGSQHPVKSHFPEWEVNFSSSLEDDYVHQSNESGPQPENPFDHSKACFQLGGDSIISQVTEYGAACTPQLENYFDHTEAFSQLMDVSTPSHVTKQGVGLVEENDNIHRSKEPMQLQFEDQEVSLNWLQSLANGVEGKEKIILSEYTSILRSYKDIKKRLSDVEMKNQGYALETAMKDKEIHSLRQSLISLQTNSKDNSDKKGSNLQKHGGVVAIGKKYTSFNVADIKLPAYDGRHATSAIEEKFRRDIDTVLEENLEFWLRFSTSFHSIQKFQTTFDGLQAEIKKLKHKKLGESTNQSETLPIDKKLREFKTELNVWLEQNMLLQGELAGKFSALSSIQEEISGTLEACLEASLEADVVKFAPYQAAKFQGELLNMQLENNKVAEELKAGIDHIRALQAEVEKSHSRLHKKFELPEPGKSNHEQISHASTKNRVPLKSFLFNAKTRKKQSVFARVNPALQKHLATNRPS